MAPYNATPFNQTVSDMNTSNEETHRKSLSHAAVIVITVAVGIAGLCMVFALSNWYWRYKTRTNGAEKKTKGQAPPNLEMTNVEPDLGVVTAGGEQFEDVDLEDRAHAQTQAEQEKKQEPGLVARIKEVFRH